MIAVWLLVIFLNDEPVIPDKPFPDELIFYSQKACEDKRADLLDTLDDDLRCIPGLIRKRVKA